MQSQCTNIYKMARTSAGYTQERWAEMIGVTAGAVKQYESGQCMPSDDVVTRMADTAVMPVMALWHLKNKSSVANNLIPDVEQVSLPQAVVQLLSEINDLQEKNVVPELLKIAKDGTISDDERPQYEDILKEIEDVISAAMVVKYAK